MTDDSQRLADGLREMDEEISDLKERVHELKHERRVITDAYVRQLVENDDLRHAIRTWGA